MAVVQAPLGGTATTNEDDEQPDATGTLASYLKGGPEGAALALMQQQRGAVGAQQQKLLEMMNQQQGPLSQTGMSDLDKASMMFQAAGALGQTTRSGGFGETLGNLGSAMAGPLSKAAEAQRARQSQLQQLQLARQKLAVEMTGQQGVPAADMLSLIKSQRERTDSETESFEPKLIAPGKYALVGDAGTIKPIPADLLGAQGASSSELSGEDFLKTQPKSVADDVRAAIAGKLKMPSPGSVLEARMQPTIEALKQYYADDPNSYANVRGGQRARVVSDMLDKNASSTGGQFRSGMAMLGHMSEVQNAADALENSDMPIANRAKWAVKEQLGGPEAAKLTDFNNAFQTYSGEAAKAIKGGVPGVHETMERMKLMNPNLGPDVMQGHVDMSKKLLIDRWTPAMDSYNKVMGTNYDMRGFIKEFAPSSLPAYDQLETKAIKGSEKHKQQQQQQQQPAAAPDAQGWVTLPNGIKVRQKQDQ